MTVKDTNIVQSSKDDRAGTMPWDMRERVQMGFLSNGVADLPKNLAYMQAAALRGLSIAPTADGWRCVIRATQGSRQVVAFVEAPRFAELFDQVAYEVSQGTLRFHPDRYARSD